MIVCAEERRGDHDLFNSSLGVRLFCPGTREKEIVTGGGGGIYVIVEENKDWEKIVNHERKLFVVLGIQFNGICK